MIKLTSALFVLFLSFAHTASAGPIPWSASDDLYFKLAAIRTSAGRVNTATDAETLLGITEHLGTITGAGGQDFLMELVTSASGDALLGGLIERITASFAQGTAGAVPLGEAKQSEQPAGRAAR